MTPPPPQWNPRLPPPDFSVPPPNMAQGNNFPRFSGPMYNQPTFIGGRGGMPSPHMNIPPPSFCSGNGNQGIPFQFNNASGTIGHRPNLHNNMNMGHHLNNNHQRKMPHFGDNIFSDAPSEVPCGFPYFNPRLPPPMPNSANPPLNQPGGLNQQGARGKFPNGNQRCFQNNNPNTNGNKNRGRGQSYRGGGQFNNNGRGGGSNRNSDGFQKKKKERIDKRDLPENNVFFCDICDRGFKTKEKHQEHIDGHQKCSYRDCPFVAAPKLVQLHMNMQHRGGLAKKIWSVETEEDIQKWIQERKKNYPTAENAKKKKERMEDRISRGEIIETKEFGKMSRGRERGRGRDRGRGRGRGRFRRGRHHDYDADEDDSFRRQNNSRNDDDDEDGPPEEIKIQRSRAADEKDLTKELIVVEDSDDQAKVKDVDAKTSEASPAKTKNDSSGSLSMLSGYGESSSDSDDDDSEEEDSEEDVKIIASSDAAMSKSSDAKKKSKKDPGTATVTTRKEDNLGKMGQALVKDLTKAVDEERETDNKSDDGGSGKKEVITISDDKSCDDDDKIDDNVNNDDADDDESKCIQISDEEGELDKKATSSSSTDTGVKVKSCQDGATSDKPTSDKSKDDKLDDESQGGRDTAGAKGVKRGHVTKAGPPDKRPRYTPAAPKKSYTLLEKLLAKEIRRERNKILQCLHFIVKNKFFDKSV